MRQYTVEELEAMPTLAVGQADDLKVDTGEERVWLSRCGAEDGQIYRIGHEHLIDGRWVVVSEYEPVEGAFDNPRGRGA